MTQSKPRDLNPEELALIQAPPASAGTMPLRIPPGTQLAIEHLNPVGDSAAAASPTGGPPDAGETSDGRSGLP